MAYDTHDLIVAWTKYRREKGRDAAYALLTKHGGQTSIASVPKENLPALADELGVALKTVNYDDIRTTPDGEVPTWEEIHARAYRVWNRKRGAT
jgi:hypothetical protein